MVHSPHELPHIQTLPSSLNLYSPQISKNLLFWNPPSVSLLFKSSNLQCKLMNSPEKSLLFHMDSFLLLNPPHQFPSLFSFKNIKRKPKLKIKSFHNKKDFCHQPFLGLVPMVKKIRFLARFQAQDSSSCVGSLGGSDFLHKNGTFFAMVVSSAKVRISPIVATLAANPTFVSGFFAWFFAQSMKVFLNFCLEKKWDFRVMCASGGMPSSHTALCTALTTSVAICHGVADSLFPVCLGFSLIVMYDAIGVRRHAGMQAEVLNMIVADLFQGHPISQRKLKELLGHTPSQVLAGALLGVVVAWFCCQGYSITPPV